MLKPLSSKDYSIKKEHLYIDALSSGRQDYSMILGGGAENRKPLLTSFAGLFRWAVRSSELGSRPTKKPCTACKAFCSRREDRIRTCDPLVPNQVRYRPALLPGQGANVVFSAQPAKAVGSSVCFNGIIRGYGWGGRGRVRRRGLFPSDTAHRRNLVFAQRSPSRARRAG